VRLLAAHDALRDHALPRHDPPLARHRAPRDRAAGRPRRQDRRRQLFAIFDTVAAAVAAARDVQEQLETANAFLPDDWDLHASIGVGFGEVLMVDDDDLFGNELNLASKLGEDIALSGETLLTEAAHKQLAQENSAAGAGTAGVTLTAREVVTGHLKLTAYALAPRG
jgi:hypothetical protein